MATLTYAGQRRTVVHPSRTFDLYYDPLHFTSSNRDHMKAAFKAQTNVTKIRYVPYFKTMFSSLRHHPRQRATLDTTDAVPSHVSRQWPGYRDQARETIIRYTKMNYDPRVHVPPKHFPPAYVTGKNRYKYFRRPIIPFLPQMPPNVVLAHATLDPLEPPFTDSTEGGGKLFDGPHTRTVHVQTDYRDSDVQTDPYTPEYVVRPGSQPELLTLAALSYGRGLPAGLAEVEMIERARAKRAWEATLPPLDDLDRMDTRRKMMEEQEREEWAFREQEIEKLQQERMELVKQMLQQREVDHHALNAKRMEHLWSKKQADKDKHFRRLHNNHVKALRKLSKDCSNPEGKLQRECIVQQYSKFDSQVYAPKTRIGVYLDSGSEQYNVKSKFTTTLDGLLELEETLPQHILYSTVKSPVRSAVKAVGMEARRQQKLNSILAQVHSEIDANRNKGKEEEKPLRLLKRVEQAVPRPPTPTIEQPEANSEERELAVVLLQRIIRGRAIQSKMFEGKERRQQLIQELRTTHALQSPEQAIQKKEAENVKAKQAEQSRLENKRGIVQDGAEMPAATHLGQRLDFLTKELVRLQEERRVAAYVMLAERQRRLREAEESGRRQREERIRRTEDEMFKQMMRVHQGSVDTYLQDMILKSMERTADQQARQEIAEKAEAINKLAHEFEHTELSGKELVAEMVHSFLLPEVEKQTMKRKVAMNQRKHLLAAHRIVQHTVEDYMQSTVANTATTAPEQQESSDDITLPEPHPQEVSSEAHLEVEPSSPDKPDETGEALQDRPASHQDTQPVHQGQLIYDDEQELVQDIGDTLVGDQGTTEAAVTTAEDTAVAEDSGDKPPAATSTPPVESGPAEGETGPTGDQPPAEVSAGDTLAAETASKDTPLAQVETPAKDTAPPADDISTKGAVEHTPVLKEVKTHSAPAETGPSEDKLPAETGPSEDKLPAETGPSEDKPPAETGPSEDKLPAETGPSDAVEIGASEDKPETSPSEDKPPAETGPSEDKPPAETGPSEDKPPAETGPSEDNPPAETGPSEDKPPAETGPSEDKPETGPSEDRPPGDISPADTPPAETGPAEDIGPAVDTPAAETGPTSGPAGDTPAAETGPTSGPAGDAPAAETGPSGPADTAETSPNQATLQAESQPVEESPESQATPLQPISEHQEGSEETGETGGDVDSS